MFGRMLGAALTATLLIGAGLLSEARAQTGDDADFEATDLNDDGTVDREEYHRRMMDTLYFADDDKDGVLTTDELPDAEPGRFEAADTDADGTVSTDEFIESRFEDFEAADQDDSGSLSAEEVHAAP
jgi:EF hand